MLQLAVPLAYGGAMATFAADSIVQRIWDPLYIDALIAMQTDLLDSSRPPMSPPDGDFTNANILYSIADRKYDVIAMMTSSAAIPEWVRYSAYGVARHLPLGDANHDGMVNGSDQGALLVNWGQTLGAAGSFYNPDFDLNRDGTIDGADQGILLVNWKAAAEPEGILSTIGNTVGYSGYIYDNATNLSLARFRWYDATEGRWVTRDPLVSITKSMLVPTPTAAGSAARGMPNYKMTERDRRWQFWLDVTGVRVMRNLYEYVDARPHVDTDDSGLGPIDINHLFGPDGPLFRKGVLPKYTLPGELPIPRGLINGGSPWGEYFRFGRGWNGPKNTGREIWRFAGKKGKGKWKYDMLGRRVWVAKLGLVGCAAGGGYLIGDQIAKHTQIDETIGDGLARLCPGCWGWVPRWRIFY